MIWAAAAVHLFTALGAVAAFFAALAVIELDAGRMFGWLALALFIDGIDGTFARAVAVRQRLPRFSGDSLDLIVDYVTYVFVPVLALVHLGKLQGRIGLMLAAGALLSSLYHFSDAESKDAAYRFIGFPALWNLVAFCVFVFELDPGATALMSLLCIILTFVPLPWVHPLRVRALRRTSIGIFSAAWFAGLAVLYAGLPGPSWARWVLGLSLVYGLGLTAYWTWKENITSNAGR